MIPVFHNPTSNSVSEPTESTQTRQIDDTVNTINNEINIFNNLIRERLPSDKVHLEKKNHSVIEKNDL